MTPADATRDEALVEAVARTIHDTDDMADTVWPDAQNDDGYRGDGAYVRLCRDPEVFRMAARAAIAAVRAHDAAHEAETADGEGGRDA